MDLVGKPTLGPPRPPSSSLEAFLNARFPVRKATRQEQQQRQLLFLSAGTAAAFSASLYNGLDCLRVRWQVAGPQEATVGLVGFTTQIVRTEGLLAGLWGRGLLANGIGMGISGALRFGYYESVRDALGGEAKTGKGMVVAGLVCGAGAYFVTTPFHLLKTMIQAEASAIGPDGRYLTGPRTGKKPRVTGLVSGIRILFAEQGISGLWRGWVPLTARGATFTGGQLVGYDGFKTLAKAQGWEDGPVLHAAAGIVAAASATLTATPADCVMSRYMASGETQVSIIVRRIYSENGLLAFWRGSSINFCRSCPVFLTYTAVYENMRHALGLGYFS